MNAKLPINAKLPDDIIRELELNGGAPLQVEDPDDHRQYLIVPFDPTGEPIQWRPEFNARRYELIDKDLAGTISPEDAVELFQLEQSINAYASRVAPLPMGEVRRLYDELLQRVGKSTSGG